MGRNPWKERILVAAVLLVTRVPGACNRSQEPVDCGVCQEMRIRGQEQPQPVRRVVMDDGTTFYTFYPTLEECQKAVDACERYFRR